MTQKLPARIPPDISRALAELDQMQSPPTDQDRWTALVSILETHGVVVSVPFDDWPELGMR